MPVCITEKIYKQAEALNRGRGRDSQYGAWRAIDLLAVSTARLCSGFTALRNQRRPVGPSANRPQPSFTTRSVQNTGFTLLIFMLSPPMPKSLASSQMRMED